jgi:transposase
MIPVGIDVSKRYVDVSIDGAKAVRYKKTTPSFGALLRSLPQNALVVMEATGTYHLSLAYYLHEHQCMLQVVNPYTAKSFARSRLSRAKTDTIDARMLSDFAVSSTARLWKPPSKATALCRQKLTVIEHLTNDSAAKKNLLESLAQYPENIRDDSSAELIHDAIASNDERIALLRREIEELQNEEFGEMPEHIASIPGIGKATTAKLIAATDGFRSFDSVKQLVAFVGLCPEIEQSGSSVLSAHLTTYGHPQLREALYMCALSAKCWHPAAKQVYADQMARHGIHQRAMIRVANLLLREVFALAKKNIAFDNDVALRKAQQRKNAHTAKNNASK